MLFNLYHLQSTHFVNIFSTLISERDSALKPRPLAAAVPPHGWCRPGGTPALRPDVGLRWAASSLPLAFLYTHIYPPTPTWADKANKNPFPFLLWGCMQPASRSGKRELRPLLAACRLVGHGHIGNLRLGSQNTVTFPRTRIHLKQPSQINILCNFMLCSIDFNDSVAVLTLLYLLLAHIRSIRCSHSQRVPVLNPEVLPCQYLFTMLLNMFFISLTVSLFLLSQQALSSTQCLKVSRTTSHSRRVPIFTPEHLSFSIRSPTPTLSYPMLPVSIPQVWVLEKHPGTFCQAPWDLREALSLSSTHTSTWVLFFPVMPTKNLALAGLLLCGASNTSGFVLPAPVSAQTVYVQLTPPPSWDNLAQAVLWVEKIFWFCFT